MNEVTAKSCILNYIWSVMITFSKDRQESPASMTGEVKALFYKLVG